MKAIITSIIIMPIIWLIIKLIVTNDITILGYVELKKIEKPQFQKTTGVSDTNRQSFYHPKGLFLFGSSAKSDITQIDIPPISPEREIFDIN